ncbi:MAG: class I SAM-dependent methyltransferase [Nitrososphaerota archaeon]
MSSKVADTTQKILARHTDRSNQCPEVILLGYCDNEVASEHLSRYIFASGLARVVVLDCASGSCYGSSMLRRSKSVEFVVSVDVDEDLLRYGKLLYGADCVLADAMHLPFRYESFDSIVSIETIEHLENPRLFLDNIKFCLKRGGKVVLSTPNKLYTSPFISKTLNPYHKSEWYLSRLLTFLKSHGFIINSVYGGGKMKPLELIRRIIGSFIKYLLGKIVKPYAIDRFY